jgi:hypothetical protein
MISIPSAPTMFHSDAVLFAWAAIACIVCAYAVWYSIKLIKHGISKL